MFKRGVISGSAPEGHLPVGSWIHRPFIGPAVLTVGAVEGSAHSKLFACHYHCGAVGTVGAKTMVGKTVCALAQTKAVVLSHCILHCCAFT